jgi:hypothetical protein
MGEEAGVAAEFGCLTKTGVVVVVYLVAEVPGVLGRGGFKVASLESSPQIADRG